MTGFAQVIHVVRKDLRQLRVLLLLYAVLIGISAENAFVRFENWNPLYALAVIFAFIVGMVIVAGLVQADSPTRSDAFWATRPLNPMAVLGAKVATTTIFILGVTLTVQAMELRTFDLSMGVELPMLVNSARSYALWLLIAMIVAAATPNLHIFIAALIGGAVVCGAVVVWVGFVPAQQIMNPWMRIALGSFGVVCGVAFVVLLYRTRDVRRGTVLFGTIPFFCIFFALGTNTSSAAIEPEIHSMASIKVELREGAAPNQLNLGFRMEGAQPGQRYRLRKADVMVFARGGDTLRVPLVPDPIVYAPDRHMSMGISLATPIPVPTVIDSIVLRGRLAVEVLGGAGTLPVKLNAAIVHDGRRTAIEKLAPFSYDSLLALRTTSVEDGTNPGSNSSSGSDIGERDSSRVKLVNDERHESIPLFRSRGQSNARLIILPGVMLRESSDMYRAGPLDRFGRGRLVDSAWLRGAHLELSQWVPKGSYPVHDTFVVR
jgi:energy-converting hydrogenase Eha subunit A